MDMTFCAMIFVLYQVAHTVLALQAHLVHLEEMEVILDRLMWASTLQNTFRVSFVYINLGLCNTTIG